MKIKWKKKQFFGILPTTRLFLASPGQFKEKQELVGVKYGWCKGGSAKAMSG